MLTYACTCSHTCTRTHTACAGTVVAAAAAWGGLAVVQGDGKVVVLKEVR